MTTSVVTSPVKMSIFNRIDFVHESKTECRHGRVLRNVGLGAAANGRLFNV
jgi:hypothetical protein